MELLWIVIKNKMESKQQFVTKRPSQEIGQVTIQIVKKPKPAQTATD